MRHNANISVTDCEFTNNFIAISIGGNNLGNQRLPVNFTLNGGIWGNKFVGGSLPAPRIGQQAFEAIALYNVVSMQIGNLSYDKNEFLTYKNSFPSEIRPCAGIYNSNSELLALNCYFEDIGKSAAFNGNSRLLDGGISTLNNGKTTFVGLGSSVVSFEGGSSGFYLGNSSGEISNAQFHLNRYGVAHESVLTKKLPGSLIVDGCKFQEFIMGGILVKSNNKIDLAILEIKNCVFDENNTIPETRNMLTIEPALPTDGSGFKINDNVFYFRFRSLASFFSATCVKLINVSKGIVSGNQFVDEGTVVGGSRNFSGGKMDGCNEIHWDANSFTGTGLISTNSETETGLNVTNSPFCRYSCNVFSNLQYGMYFDDNCDKSILTYNEFNSNSVRGLFLVNQVPPKIAVIGPQDRLSNTWVGNGAEFEYLNFNGANIQHVFNVQRSLFSIQTNNESNVLWANPRIVGGINDEINHYWFQYKPFQIGDPLPVYPCIPEPAFALGHKFDNIDFSVMNGTFMPWDGYAADTWETSFYLFKQMTEGASSLPSGSLEATWYGGVYNSSLGRMWRLYNNYILLNGKYSATTAIQLLVDLNAINTTTIYEQNLKTDLRIFIEKFLEDGTPFSVSQLSELTAIADQCRSEGGLGVVLARIALGQPSNRVDDCPEDRSIDKQSIDKAQRHVRIDVFPNPVSDELKIYTEDILTKGALKLFDNRGQYINTWELKSNQIVIYTGDMPTGIYFLELIEDGHTVTREKVVILR